MRKSLTPELETKRVQLPGYEIGSGPNGAFVVQGPTGATLRIIADDGTDPTSAAFGFEHVSVSVSHRDPNWREMAFVKRLFWENEEAVYQLHPPESQWVNNHPHVLHLWRHVSRDIPLPPMIAIGFQEDGTYANRDEAYRAAVKRGLL